MITLTPKARELLARSQRSKRSAKWSERSGSGVAYPEFRVVFCPRKSGIVWMARHRRRNISEHATREEAKAALEVIKNRSK